MAHVRGGPAASARWPLLPRFVHNGATKLQGERMTTLRTCTRALGGALLAALVAALLAACGGGGGSPGTTTGGSVDGGGSTPPPPGTAVVDKYIGTWVACAPADTGGFERDTLALNKSGATTMVFSETRFNFPSPDCTGNGTQVGGTVTGSFLFVGTKTISGQTVDKIDITTTGSGTLTRQVIVIASDAKLHFGLTSPVDASGYPDTLDSVGWVRQ
jgi:hypothetical protein